MSTETFETECDLGPCRVSFTVGNEQGFFDAYYYMTETLNDDDEWVQVDNNDEWEHELDTPEKRAEAMDIYQNGGN